MKIGIDARFYGIAGIGRYIKNVIRELEHLDTENEYVIFMSKEGYDEFQPTNPKFTKKLADVTWYSFAEQILMLWHYYKEGLDLLYVPHLNVPILYFKKYVITLHDLIVHDASDAATTRLKPYFYFKKFVYRLVVWWVSRQAKRIIVPSQKTKEEIVERIGTNPEKIIVSYNGLDPVFVKVRKELKDSDVQRVFETYSVRKPYLVSLSSFYPHKNQKMLVDALELLKNENYTYNSKPLQLVLIGKQDKFAEEVWEYIRVKGLEEEVILPGRIAEGGYTPDEDVAILLAEAELFVFASVKEGFGIMFLEAMAMGTPNLLSNISTMPEVGGDAAAYFDPYDVEDLAKNIKKVIEDEKFKKMLVQRGFERAKDFSWRDLAKSALDVFEEELRDV